MLSETVWTWLLIVGPLAPLVAAIAYVVGLVAFRRGHATHATAALMTGALGMFMGTELTRAIGRLQAAATFGTTIAAVVPLAFGLGGTIALAASHRRRLAGWFVIGLAVPWTALFAAYAIELARGEDLAPLLTLAGLAAGAVPIGLGLLLVRHGDPAPVPDAFAPAGRPGSRRPGSLTAGLVRRSRYGVIGPAFVLSLLVASAVATFGARLPVLLQVGIVGLAVIGATELELRAMPQDIRRALVAYHWIGRGAIARLERVSGRRMPRTKPAMTAWLAEPETEADRSFRPELLAYLGRADEAREVLARVVATTAAERFHHATAAWELAWRQRRMPPEVDFEALIEEIGGPDDPDRRLAEGLDAWRRSEVALADQDPGWVKPLVRFGEELGGRIRRHTDPQRRRLLASAGLAAGVLFLVTRGLPG